MSGAIPFEMVPRPDFPCGARLADPWCRMWRFAVVGFLFLMTGCGGPTYEPGEDGCARPSLAEGALVSYSSGSSWAGDRIWKIVAFGDGRLVVNESVDARVPAERVSQLLADIAATEVEDEDDGCYWPSEEDRLVDVSGSTLELREGGRVRMWSEVYPGKPPSALREANAVMDRFRTELLEAKVVPDNGG